MPIAVLGLESPRWLGSNRAAIAQGRTPPPIDSAHYRQVAKAMVRDGRVVPLLGAGANLCGRNLEGPWRPGTRSLPSGAELAAHLVDSFDFAEASRDPELEASHDLEPAASYDLARVAQYVSVMLGDGPLYNKLHTVFVGDYEPTPLHRFLALVPSLARGQTPPPRECHQLIVTTNYDDALERAFDDAEEQYDLLAYIADGDDRGRFLHRMPDGNGVVIEKPNEYRGLALEERTVILKIHGAVDRNDGYLDSYVITEDNYIDYLTRTDFSSLVPAVLAAKLRQSHILFLGYSMRDWNLRALFYRVWQERKRGYKSWAIQLHPEPLEQAFWKERGVDILDVSLESYLEHLKRAVSRLEEMPGAP